MKSFLKKIFAGLAVVVFAFGPVIAFADGTVSGTATASDLEATITLTATGNTAPVRVIVDYGTDATNLSGHATAVSVPIDSIVPVQITGLQASTTYYFSAHNETTPATIYFSQQSFQTHATGTGYDLSTGSVIAPTCTSSADGYCLLAPLGGISVITDAKLADYFGMIYKILIGLAGVLAVVMIFWGGVQYMTTDAFSGKSEGKERITNAVLGLILALGSYAILNTVNPKLLNFTFGIDKVDVTYTPGDVDGPLLSTTTGLFTPVGINCTGTGGATAIPSIVNSYLGKVTYFFGGKGSAGPSGTVFYDCSGFVNRVLECAGMSYTPSGTSGIFATAEQVTNPNQITATTVNGIALKPGDLLGWTAGGSEGSGHVVIYIGNGQVAESHGGSSTGNAESVSTNHVTKYINRIKFIKRAQ